MKKFIPFFVLICFLSCTPKGPQTFSSPYVGKTKQDLIAVKGIAKDIKIYGKTEVYIYKNREEYFGKQKLDGDKPLVPKKVYSIEHIYYINEKGFIYKYQVWKKRVD